MSLRYTNSNVMIGPPKAAAQLAELLLANVNSSAMYYLKYTSDEYICT
jgi:hypothetical protein